MSDINRNKGESATVYRTFEDGYVVRAMTPSDIDIVVGWYSGMGSISPYDLATALAVFPPGPGFYIGELDGEVIRLVGRKTRGGESDTWRGGRHLEGRATPGGEGYAWRRGRHLEWRATPGGEGDTWREERYLAGRATPGREDDAWRGGRHLEGRVTSFGEGDTWTGGRHLGHPTFSYASCTFTKE